MKKVRIETMTFVGKHDNFGVCDHHIERKTKHAVDERYLSHGESKRFVGVALEDKIPGSRGSGMVLQI